MQIRVTSLVELNSAHLVTEKHELGRLLGNHVCSDTECRQTLSVSGHRMQRGTCCSKAAAENAKMLSFALF